jgi:tetratricopeptide (TPR) repeat protein
VAYQQGDYETARSLYEQILAIKRALGNDLGIGNSLHDLGIVAYAQGEYETARSLFEESLAIRRDLGNRLGVAASLEAVAALACGGPTNPGRDPGTGTGERSREEDRAEAARRAARLFGAAEALREVIGAPLPPGAQEAHRLAVSRTRALLSKEAFTAAWLEGRAMPLDHAITEALRGAGSPR